MLRGLILAALGGGLALTATSCKYSDYCLNCETGDGGVITGSDSGVADATPADAFVESDGAICMPTNGGIEICDGKDNDCDGKVDESLTDVGSACGSNVGTCTTGTTSCVNGAIVCSGVQPTAEICDGLDNDCDGSADNGDPGGGASCGIASGACTHGVDHCVAGAITCVGGVQPATETCNNIDDDCDGKTDEDVASAGSCGHAHVGQCEPGTLVCSGGTFECTGGTNPTLETCNHLDDDCDGSADNGFNTKTDPLNCGDCTYTDTNGVMHDNKCEDKITTNQNTAIPGCHATLGSGTCYIAACASGYVDLDGNLANGCEYACSPTNGGVELCDGLDNDCDGKIDETVTAPMGLSCTQTGACVNSTTKCFGKGGWGCHYPGANVSETTTSTGNEVLIQETKCDNIDNDCDGLTDETYPTKGSACHDTGSGVCERTGSNACVTTGSDAGSAVSCVLTSPVVSPGTETCNNLDDDCDGKVDEGAANGTLGGVSFVTLSGVNIMQYEASRPDASGSAQGATTAVACSRAGVLPWTNVTYPEAVAACATVGATLCTEAQWQAACIQETAPSYPLPGPGTSGNVFVETETPISGGNIAGTSGSANGSSWSVATTTPSYDGTGYMISNGSSSYTSYTSMTVGNAFYIGNAPHLEYQFTLTSGTAYTVWVRAHGGGSTSDELYVCFDQTISTCTDLTATHSGWGWVGDGTTFTPATTGTHTIDIYQREKGVSVDALTISQDGVNPQIDDTSVWAYATNQRTSAPTTCNINDSTDTIQVTGHYASCYANGGGTNDAYDMTGNVKEWALARSAGEDPIRGGAADSTEAGSTCEMNFSLADDTFLFPNVGFRCCK